MVAGVSDVIAMKLRTFDSVLCFGDSDWWYHNRGHADMQFMRRFAKRWPALYVNSLGVQMPAARQGRMFLRRVARKMKSFARFYRDSGEGFGVLSPLYVPLRRGLLAGVARSALTFQLKSVLRARGMRRPLIWVACPTAADVVDRLPSAGVVFQLSDFYGALFSEDSGSVDDTACAQERRISERADLIVCASDRLYERARERFGHAEYVDHGVDFDLFDAAAKRGCRPREFEAVREPLIGFFGNLDGNTVDRVLLDRVIEMRPQYRFALVGPMAADFEPLRERANVIAVGQQPYREIPRYGAAFDVCLMPWLQNEWIEHCNPIKLKEYLALGKPVVSTPFPELRRCASLCYTGGDAEAFAQAIDRALAEDTPHRRQARRDWACQNTWDAKFDRVLDLLKSRGIVPHDEPNGK